MNKEDTIAKLATYIIGQRLLGKSHDEIYQILNENGWEGQLVVNDGWAIAGYGLRSLNYEKPEEIARLTAVYEEYKKLQVPKP